MAALKPGTQHFRLLNLLKERGKDGAYVYEFTTSRNYGGLGISQYGRVIKELRDGKFNDTRYNIVNVEPGHFVYRPPVKQGQVSLFDSAWGGMNG